jgi:acyl-CoA synthetase (AMP-forming)/AMP-acid ligase II
MIITGGENVFAGEVEEAILRHPAVAQAAVIGVPDARWGEAIQAIVVCKPGQAVPAEDIIRHCAALIAGYKKPKHVAMVDELPRNPVGKIDKKLLRERYGKAGTAQPPQ